jgi:hypothetical protein
MLHRRHWRIVLSCNLRFDTIVCMLDHAAPYALSNELFKFSAKDQQWEQQVSGSPPSAREKPGMVSVGSDLYMFGGRFSWCISNNPAVCPPRGADEGNLFFRFSTASDKKWEHLDAELRVSGSSPSSDRSDFRMASVGSDFYVFGGYAYRCELVVTGFTTSCNGLLQTFFLKSNAFPFAPIYRTNIWVTWHHESQSGRRC